MMTKWQAVLLVVIIVTILAFAFSMPENPLGNRCMDVWCLNH